MNGWTYIKAQRSNQSGLLAPTLQNFSSANILYYAQEKLPVEERNCLRSCMPNPHALCVCCRISKIWDLYSNCNRALRHGHKLQSVNSLKYWIEFTAITSQTGSRMQRLWYFIVMDWNNCHSQCSQLTPDNPNGCMFLQALKWVSFAWF